MRHTARALRGLHPSRPLVLANVPARTFFARSAVLGLNEDQAEFYHHAESFGRDHLAPSASEWDAKKHFPTDVLAQAGAVGFGAIYVPSPHGAGMTRLDTAVVVEALARACPSTAAYISIHNMCCGMISKYGRPTPAASTAETPASSKPDVVSPPSHPSALQSVHDHILPSLCSMQSLASYCLTEPSAGSDAASLQTRATRYAADGTERTPHASLSGGDACDETDFYVVNGGKAFISGAGTSAWYVVMVRTDPSTAPSAGGGSPARGISCLLIPGDAPGVSFGDNENKLGWNCQPTRQVFFDNVKVPVTHRLGKEGEGFKIAMEGLDGGRINIAACSVGAAAAAVEKAHQYALQRKQFGRPIASFQASQFKLAEAAATVHTCRLAVRAAAEALDAGDRDRTALCAAAKLVATERCYTVIDEMLQLFGGYGYLRDYEVEKLLRDCRVHRILEGTNEVMRTILYREMARDAAV
eukprot:TRINITY_DN5719_c0_g1_i1.p1 TRINITY_DN5719_c0_g1~~TRINITY_DN5719_c0_g1_i1.p1  ORF type:complete len:471 (-),score=102.47 TRINITY_DN5719_c0_g1_i1:158-1570(-)